MLVDVVDQHRGGHLYLILRSSSAAAKSRGRFQDLVGPTQFPHLTLELGQPLGVIARGAWPDPAVDLGLTDPVPQRLGVDPELIGDPLDRSTRGLRILPGVQCHSRGPLLELNAVLPRCSLDSD